MLVQCGLTGKMLWYLGQGVLAAEFSLKTHDAMPTLTVSFVCFRENGSK